MLRLTNFESALASSLPATFELLMSAHLVVHPAVSRIILHGSRGPAGGYRPMSDIDLSLIVDGLPQYVQRNTDSFLLDILQTTRSQWQSTIEPDLAVVFEICNCGLKCFDKTTWNEQFCTIGGIGCFGLYKVGKGFHGFVTNAGVQVRRMYPCLKIWQRTQA